VANQKTVLQLQAFTKKLLLIANFGDDGRSQILFSRLCCHLQESFNACATESLVFQPKSRSILPGSAYTLATSPARRGPTTEGTMTPVSRSNAIIPD